MINNSELVAVIDFETTGLSPNTGARPTEIAIALIQNGVVIDRFQSLMNPKVKIPAYVEELTGITNLMVEAAPSIQSVMKQAFAFCRTKKIIAHNASFDKKFWLTEKNKTNNFVDDSFLCTMLLSRRVYKSSPNHKLKTIATYLNLNVDDSFHRAQVDVDVTVQLYLKILYDVHIANIFGEVNYEKLLYLQKAPASKFVALNSFTINSKTNELVKKEMSAIAPIIKLETCLQAPEMDYQQKVDLPIVKNKTNNFYIYLIIFAVFIYIFRK